MRLGMHRGWQLGRELESSLRRSLWFGGRRRLQHLGFPAAEFNHIFANTGKVCELYAGHPLSGLSPHKRGMLLQDLCKTVLVSAHPDLQLEEPVSGRCVNGQRRAPQQALWDWTLGGRKVECKSCRLSWTPARNTWSAQFEGAKFPLSGIRAQAVFDDLYLVVDTPDSVQILKHDLRTGVCMAGKKTSFRGHTIVVRGQAGAADWRHAWASILRKLCAGRGQCEVIEDIPWSDQRLQPIACLAVEDETYHRDPLRQMTPALRGQRIEQMGFEIDKKLNPRSTFHKTQANFQHDWVRDGLRVELKHTKIAQRKVGAWRCHFSNIKCAMDGVRDANVFDELWLAVYSPIGIDFFQSSGRLPYLSVGLRGGALGHDLEFRSPVHETELGVALCSIRRQLEQAGCCRMASVRW